MNSKVTFLLVTLLVLPVALLVFLNVSSGQEGSPLGKAGRYGFVNIKLVMDEYLRTKHLESRIETLRSRREEELRSMKEEIEQIETELALLRRGTQLYNKRSRELGKKKTLLRFEEDSLSDDLEIVFAEATRQIFKDIVSYCEQVRKLKGFVAIMRIKTGELSRDKERLVSQINNTSVVAWDSLYDITTDVVDGLNRRYEREKGK